MVDVETVDEFCSRVDEMVRLSTLVVLELSAHARLLRRCSNCRHSFEVNEVPQGCCSPALYCCHADVCVDYSMWEEVCDFSLN